MKVFNSSKMSGKLAEIFTGILAVGVVAWIIITALTGDRCGPDWWREQSNYASDLISIAGDVQDAYKRKDSVVFLTADKDKVCYEYVSARENLSCKARFPESAGNVEKYSDLYDLLEALEVHINEGVGLRSPNPKFRSAPLLIVKESIPFTLTTSEDKNIEGSFLIAKVDDASVRLLGWRRFGQYVINTTVPADDTETASAPTVLPPEIKPEEIMTVFTYDNSCGQ